MIVCPAIVSAPVRAGAGVGRDDDHGAVAGAARPGTDRDPRGVARGRPRAAVGAATATLSPRRRARLRLVFGAGIVNVGQGAPACVTLNVLCAPAIVTDPVRCAVPP